MRGETRRRGTQDLVRGGVAILLLVILCLALTPSLAAAQTMGGAGRSADELEMDEEGVDKPAGTSQEKPAMGESMTPSSPATETNPAPDDALPADDVALADPLVAASEEATLDAQGSNAKKTFPDVSPNAWYAGVVSRAASLGIISGYSNGRFGPNDKVTRGQVAVILWNMVGKPTVRGGARSFPDVRSGAYYYDAVRWASSVGVVSGYKNGRFGPNDLVTREQMAAMIASFARAVGWGATGSTVDFQGMRDAADVSVWAQSAVGWCCRNRVLTGSNSLLRPLGNATRAEAAKMIVFFIDLLHSGEVSDPYSRARDAAMAQGKQVLEGTVRVMSAREVAKLDMDPAYNAFTNDSNRVPKSLRDFYQPSNYDWDRSSYAVLMLDNAMKVSGKQVDASTAQVCRYILLGTHDVPGHSLSTDTTSRWNPYNGKRVCLAGAIWYPSGLRIGFTASMGSQQWKYDAQILYTR